MSRIIAKENAAKKALEYVKEGMKIGLGSGTTSEIFVKLLANSGKKIAGLPSSSKIEQLAKSLNIPLLNPEDTDTLDLTVDGADEIAPDGTLLKGGGGAFFREKIIAAMCNELIIIADSSKLVKTLGTFPLPVEVASFGVKSTIKAINQLGYFGKIRTFFLTDEGNLIYDLHLTGGISSPKKMHDSLLEIPGVIETGLFIDFNPTLCIG